MCTCGYRAVTIARTPAASTADRRCFTVDARCDALPMTALRLQAVAAGALTALALAAPATTEAAADASSEWRDLARTMTAPWPGLQRADGSFRDYVVAADPHGAPRDPYGRSFMGLALLQAGLRDGNDRQVTAGLKAIGQAAAHPVIRQRIVFENLALSTAYNVARTT